MPVDGAVGIDVFGNDLILGVDKAFEAERVGATTTGEDIPDRSKRSRFVGENLRRAILGRHHLTGIRAAEQNVVAGSAIQPVSAETAGQEVFAAAAVERVVTRATPDLVVAAAAAERVVPSHAGESVGAAAAEQDIPARSAVQMIMIGATASQLREEVFEAAAVKEPIDIEACHYLPFVR
jgi:hypothetical protein